MKDGKQYASPEDLPESEKQWMEALGKIEGFLANNEFLVEKPEQLKKLLKAWLIRELLPPLREDLERMKLEE